MYIYILILSVFKSRFNYYILFVILIFRELSALKAVMDGGHMYDIQDSHASGRGAVQAAMMLMQEERPGIEPGSANIQMEKSIQTGSVDN